MFPIRFIAMSDALAHQRHAAGGVADCGETGFSSTGQCGSVGSLLY